MTGDKFRDQPPTTDPPKPTLTEQELQNLTVALQSLQIRLRQAVEGFNNGPKGGRDGAIASVEAVLMFFTALLTTGIFPDLVDERLQAPLVRLHTDLMALDDGTVGAMLAPAKPPKGGRARASALYNAFIAAALFSVERLCELGLTESEAARAVAEALNDEGFKLARRGRGGDRRVTSGTLRNWRKKLADMPEALATYKAQTQHSCHQMQSSGQAI
jgi:hypothetical protein